MAAILVQTYVQTGKDLEVCCSMAFFVISKPGHISALESISRLLGSHLLGAGAASEQD